MTKEEAINFLKENIQAQNLIKHSLAVGAIMKSLAERFGENSEKWETCGLLHDIDYEKTKNEPEKHSLVGAEMLKEKGLDEEIVEAVKAHNEIHKIKPETLMAKALYVCDPLSGLIVAATLVLPSRKLKDLTVQNVLNRFKENSFARGANREIIKKCQDYLNLSLEEFIEIALKAMQGIAEELGL
ncbi:HDIG domain-containing protein [bacterium]|nr:HDIG domain-containing protein [bacterium]